MGPIIGRGPLGLNRKGGVIVGEPTTIGESPVTISEPPMSDRSTSHWLIPVALGTFLFFTAVFSKPFAYGALHLAMLAILYLLFGWVLYGPTAIAARGGPLAALIGSIAVAFVLVLHYREQTRPSGTAESLDKPAVLAAFLVTCVVVAAVYFFVIRALSAGDHWRRAAVSSLVAVLIFLVSLAVFYRSSNTFRWHLLRHNTMLGALSYHLFAEDTTSVREALWAEGTGAEEAVPPSGANAGSETMSSTAPNLVFVLVDTLRADAMAAYGGDPELMPFVNSLAEKSLVFADVKANSSWTFPSMASFFTGLLPEEHGAVWGSSLSAEKWTVAEAMASRGFRTVAFLSNGVAMREDRGMGQGFEEFYQLGVTGSRYPPAEQINEAVFDWLQRAAEPGTARQPVFLYVHYLDPHVPYLAVGGVDPASHREAVDAYESDLRYLDGHLSALIEAVEGRLEGPTFVFFVADHGEEFGEHGERGHGRVLYDEVLKIPAFLYLGEGGGSGRIDAKLEGRDFYDLLNLLAAAADIYVRAWARASARSERYAATYYTNSSPIYEILRPYRAAICLRAIEKDGYTLIWSGQGDTYELYDMTADPGQLRNIAAAEPDIVAELAAALRSAPSYWSPKISQAFTEEELEQLRALGYLR